MYEYLDISLDIYHYYRSEEEQPGSVSELELSTNLREVFKVIGECPYLGLLIALMKAFASAFTIKNN